MSGADKINQRRDDLEELADSGNPAAWVAKTLLEAAEKAEEGR